MKYMKLSFLALFLFLSTDIKAVSYQMRTVVGGGQVLVTLPFKYKNFTPIDKVVNVYQQSYFILEAQDPRYDYAYLGPLSPCIGVIIRNPLTSSILVAHKDQYVGMDSIASSIFSMNNIENLDVHLFTCSMGDRYETERDGIGKSYKDHYQGRSQQEELEYLKHYFERLGIPSEKITTTLFIPQTQENIFYGQYAGCQKSIVVDRNGQIFSTSQYKENLWKLKDKVAAMLNVDQNTLGFQHHFFEIVSNSSKQLVKNARGGFNLNTSYGELDLIKQP